MKRKCLRCGNEWIKRMDGEPKMCPACKSRHWDTVANGARGGRPYKERYSVYSNNVSSCGFSNKIKAIKYAKTLESAYVVFTGDIDPGDASEPLTHRGFDPDEDSKRIVFRK